MRARLPPLAAALLLRSGVAVGEDVLDDVERRFRRRFVRRGLLGFGEHAAAERALGRVAALAAVVLRLALLPPGEERRGDEDRRIRTGGDADEQREGEVLERRTAEEEQRGARRQR